jgi:hypothetical protein
MDKKVYHDRDFDELLEKTKHNIEKYGLQVISIKASDYLPSFSYSIGLLESYRRPELICFGLSINLMHTLINDVAALIKQGEKIEPGRNYENIFANSVAQFVQVDAGNVPDYFKLALKYYQLDQIPAMQLDGRIAKTDSPGTWALKRNLSINNRCWTEMLLSNSGNQQISGSSPPDNGSIWISPFCASCTVMTVIGNS